MPDQFIDRTKGVRKATFFERDIVAHTGFAEPVCRELAGIIYKEAVKTGAKIHKDGVYLNMEGPQFSTKAESNLYRQWGADIIGMTNLTEAKLAREAEMCYVTLAAVTDYDCWRDTGETVTVEMILDNLKKNVDKSKQIIKSVVSGLEDRPDCACRHSLEYAIVTRRNLISQATKDRLKVIAGRYLGLSGKD